MQLPPTDFFSAKSDGADEEGLLISEDGETFEYDLSSNSFLNHAAKNLPSRMLGWHYRSRSESLISFSNWAFYQGKLLTVPEQRLATAAQDEIVVQAAEDGSANVAKALTRPVSFHFVTNGIYDNRRNRGEADYIAQLVRGMLSQENCPSIGIVAFSEAQQSEIESALTRLGEQDKAFRDRIEAELEREVDGQFVGLLIKNLENIQGDERDIVIISICYANGPDGKMRMNFGPINQSGGEKRLNVAFSRAKHHMMVVSSIQHTQITNEYNEGANCLKNYLKYAAACSSGDSGSSQRVLRELAVWKDLDGQEQSDSGVVARQLAAALAERGYAIDTGVGMSHFRCDIAARHHGEHVYSLGILIDTDAHYQQDDLLERELLRPALLQIFGWRIAHVLARDWYLDRACVIDRLVNLIEGGEEVGSADDDADGEADEDVWTASDGPEQDNSPEDGRDCSPDDVPATGTDDASPAAAEDAISPELNPAHNADSKRYFEFIGSGSRKFWELEVAGKIITIRFGRIGTKGQVQKKVFVDDAAARNLSRGLIAEKVAKGYQEKRLAD